MAKEKTWAGFKGQLPPWESDDQEFNEKVAKRRNELMEQMQTNAEFAQFLKANKMRKKEISTEERELNINIAATQTVLAERLDNESMQSFRLSSGELFYIQDVPYSSIKDNVACKNWFVENDMEEMLSVQWTSLNALVKERLKAGQPVPDGVKVYMKTTVEMRQG